MCATFVITNSTLIATQYMHISIQQYRFLNVKAANFSTIEWYIKIMISKKCTRGNDHSWVKIIYFRHQY